MYKYGTGDEMFPQTSWYLEWRLHNQWCGHKPEIEDFRTAVGKKTQCSGSSHAGLAKIILRGTIKGGRRKGILRKKRQAHDIKEWTGLE